MKITPQRLSRLEAGIEQRGKPNGREIVLTEAIAQTALAELIAWRQKFPSEHDAEYAAQMAARLRGKIGTVLFADRGSA